MDPSPILVATVVIDRLHTINRPDQISELPLRQTTRIATMPQRDLRLVRLGRRDRAHNNPPGSLIIG
jgi:hypothetical protein